MGTLWNIRNLEKEVLSGSSVLIIVGNGVVERCVALTVIKLIRTDGCMLVQLGTWSKDKGVTAGCRLPGAKHLEGEIPRTTIQRHIDTELHPFAPYITVDGETVDYTELVRTSE